MTSKIIVNTIEADTGISSVTFASNINLQNDSSILVSSSGVRLGTGSTIAAPSANEITLSTNSAERLRIDSAGLVGIGTDNPGQKLVIYDNVPSGTSNVFINNTGGDGVLYILNNDQYSAGLGTLTDNGSYIDLSGKWTSASPAANRTFGRIGAFKENNTSANGAGYLGLYSRPDGSGLTERVRISSTGNVGIGTENPLNGVDIVQSDSRTRVTAYGHIITRNHNHSVTNYWSIAPRNGGELDIGYGSADSDGTVTGDKVTITTAGRIGINETSPIGNLHIGNLPTGSGNVNVVTLDRDDGTLVYGIDYNGTSNLVSFTGNNKQFAFANKSGSAEAVRILNTGGITFNGDTATANALNDYEQGTLGWRLQRSNSIGSGSNHSDTSITYTKVGNRVYVSGYLYTQNTGNSTGILVELRDNSNVNNYATLPYVPNQAGGFPITGTRTIDDSYRNMAVTFRQGQSQVYIYNDDGNNAYLKNSNNVNIGSSQTHLVIQFCGSYTTNS